MKLKLFDDNDNLILEFDKLHMNVLHGRYYPLDQNFGDKFEIINDKGRISFDLSYYDDLLLHKLKHEMAITYRNLGLI